MKKSLIRIGIVAGIILVLALVSWWFVRDDYAFPDALHNSDIAPLASITPFPMVYDNAPSDWQHYSSSSLGFSVSYPSGWTYGSCGPQCVGWAPEGSPAGQYVMGVIKSTSQLSDIIEQAAPYLADNSDVKLGSATWTKLTLQHPTSGDIITSHFVQRGANLYEFGIASEDEDMLAIYGKMVASLKFLK